MIMSASRRIHEILTSFLFFASILVSPIEVDASDKKQTKNSDIKRVFINASKNRDGLTADYAKKIFLGMDYEKINLVDYRISQIGQESKDDQFFEVIKKLSHADVIVIGTPVYWSDMTGYLKTFIDRLAETMDVPLESEKAPLKGADVYLIIQGTEPTNAIPGITTVIKHICRRFFMNYEGLVLNTKEAKQMNQKIKGDKK